MLIHQILLTNLLSFGENSEPISLNKGLNVLIGPNASGKSNLLEAISLLQAAPKDFTKPIRDGGGIREWLWKGGSSRHAEAILEAVIEYPFKQEKPMPLRHTLRFTEVSQRLEIKDERIENREAYPGHEEPYFHYRYQNGSPVLNTMEWGYRKLTPEDVDMQQSILAQRKDPDLYPEVTYLGQVYGKIKLYRDWQFGRYTPARLPQQADLPSLYLEENLSNLSLVLSRLKGNLALKKRMLGLLQELYESVEDFDFQIEGGTVQVFFHEAELGYPIPATRLSDGTLRFLCLLTILLHPEPPPLICIEEPELGLHPDVLPVLVDLLKEAGQHTQLIVTTHSADLVDELSDMPEAVFVCEKEEDSTRIKQLDKEELAVWLEKYRLGQLWRRGDIGGNRW